MFSDSNQALADDGVKAGPAALQFYSNITPDKQFELDDLFLIDNIHSM